MAGRSSQQLEYFLQGSIEEHSLLPLRNRLKGLCDPCKINKFSDHEIVYVLRGNQSNVVPVTLRARCSLDSQETPWQLRYLGHADQLSDKSRNVLIRSYIEVMATDNLTTFLEELDFAFESEYVAKGYYYKKGNIRITISRIHRLPTRGSLNHMETISSSYLVETSSLTHVQQDTIGDELKSFAEQLKPIVHLEKVDHRKIQLQAMK